MYLTAFSIQQAIAVPNIKYSINVCHNEKSLSLYSQLVPMYYNLSKPIVFITMDTQ